MLAITVIFIFLRIKNVFIKLPWCLFITVNTRSKEPVKHLTGWL